MIMPIQAHSAQIIPFPSRVVAASRKLASPGKVPIKGDLPVIEVGAGWYHQAAIDADLGDQRD